MAKTVRPTWPHHRHLPGGGGVFIRALDDHMEWAVVYEVRGTPPHLLAELATSFARPTIELQEAADSVSCWWSPSLQSERKSNLMNEG